MLDPNGVGELRLKFNEKLSLDDNEISQLFELINYLATELNKSNNSIMEKIQDASNTY